MCALTNNIIGPTAGTTTPHFAFSAGLSSPPHTFVPIAHSRLSVRPSSPATTTTTTTTGEIRFSFNKLLFVKQTDRQPDIKGNLLPFTQHRQQPVFSWNISRCQPGRSWWNVPFAEPEPGHSQTHPRALCLFAL